MYYISFGITYFYNSSITNDGIDEPNLPGQPHAALTDESTRSLRRSDHITDEDREAIQCS